jgi:hypothetical protein
MKKNVIQKLWENKYLAADIYSKPLIYIHGLLFQYENIPKALIVTHFLTVRYMLSHGLSISTLWSWGCITQRSFSVFSMAL